MIKNKKQGNCWKFSIIILLITILTVHGAAVPPNISAHNENSQNDFDHVQNSQMEIINRVGLGTVGAGTAGNAEDAGAAATQSSDTIHDDDDENPREHKLHNIVLYPDKHSWCSALMIKQVITHSGCKSIEINNTVCVGACFSYAIPNVEPSDPGEIILPYCDSCQPSDTIWKHINLECDPMMNDGQTEHSKSIEIILNCSCNSCDKLKASSPSTNKSKIKSKKSKKSKLNPRQNQSNFIDNNDIDNNGNIRNRIDNDSNDDSDDDSDDDSNEELNELPDILTAVHNFHNFTINSTKSNRDDNDDLDNEDDDDDRIEIGSHSNDQENSDADDVDHDDDGHSTGHFNTIRNLKKHKIVHLIRQIQEQNLQLDKMELMKVLSLLRNNLNDGQTNGKINTEADESADPDADANHDKIINDFIANLKIENHSMDILNYPNKDLITQSKSNLHKNSPNSQNHHQHHRLGEHLGNGHLIKGPHGALIVEQDSKSTISNQNSPSPSHSHHAHHQKFHSKHGNHHNNHEKLNVNPNDLKLNHAGTMLWYDGNFMDDRENLKHKNSKQENLLDIHGIEEIVDEDDERSAGGAVAASAADVDDDNDDDDDDDESDHEMKLSGKNEE